MVQTILVLEDDENLRQYLQTLLTQEGYVVWTARDVMEARKMFEKRMPDLILLDLGLPIVTGETLCKEIKESNPDVKIIILTGKDSLNDVVQGFSLGADDYVKKPFQTEELLARIKARLHQNVPGTKVLQLADLEINTDAVEVKRNGHVIPLTPQEFKLLEYLVTNNGRVLPREMILSRLWGDASDVETRVVDVYIGYLRKKIDADYPKKLIRSVRGFGYMMKA